MEDFTIEAMWGPRSEEPEQIAGRIRSLLTQLRPITPAFRRWYQVIDDDNMPELDEDGTWLDSVVASDVCTGELSEPIPYLGYMPRTTNEPRVFSTRPDSVVVMTKAGSRSVFNEVKIGASNRQELPPSLVNYPVVRQTILAVSQAFEPLWTQAGPYCLWEGMDMFRYASDPIITPCWMIHLSPPLARRLAPPPGIVAERYGDGSLFLSATDQTFDPENSAHVETAHRLFAALDSLQEKKPREEWRP